MNVLRKLPIRWQMYIIGGLTLGVIVALLLFNYSRNASLMVKNNEVYTKDLFSQMEQTIMSNYDVIKWLAYNIAYNKSIQEYLLDGDPLSKLERYPTLRNLFFNLSSVQPGIVDFVVIGKNGNTFSLDNNANSFGDFMPKKAESYFSKVQKCEVNGGTEESYCFAVGTNIFSANINNLYAKEIGRIILIIEASALTGGYNLKSFQTGTSVYLLDRNNTIFMSNNHEMIGQPFDLPQITPDQSGLFRLNGELNHIQVNELPQIGGKIVRLIPDYVFFHDIRKLREQSLIALGVGMLLLTIPFFLVLNNMIFPLNKLYNYMRITGRGDLSKKIELSGSNEAEVIGFRYNQMLSDVQDITKRLMDSNERLLKSEIEKKRTEYDFLKSQVNPHFLYNTLDAIRGIAAERQVPEIREMTRALGRIFRYSIKGNDFVTLTEEIRIVEAYMNIQTIRFSNRFEFDYRVSEELMNLVIPKMILQPIVENAVYHGLEPRYEQGTLTLTALMDSRNNQDLVITIADDGVGIDEAKLKGYQSLLQEAERDVVRRSGSGIGLWNVHNRLKFLFGQSYGLDIESIERGGTVVTLRIPAQTEGGAANV